MHTHPHPPAHTLKHKSIPQSGLIGINTLKLAAACLLMQISRSGSFRGAESVATSWVVDPPPVTTPQLISLLGSVLFTTSSTLSFVQECFQQDSSGLKVLGHLVELQGAHARPGTGWPQHMMIKRYITAYNPIVWSYMHHGHGGPASFYTQGNIMEQL